MGKTTTKGTKGTTTKGTTTPTTPIATFTKPVPVTPKVRKGTSTIANPVGNMWVGCINATIQNGNHLHPRKVYHQVGITMGVTYYTVRTQVNRYLQWVHGGSVPTQLPKGVTLPPNYVPPTNL